MNKPKVEKPKEEIQKIEEDGVIVFVGYKGYLTHHDSEIKSGKFGDKIFIPFTPKQVEDLINATEENLLKEHGYLGDIKKEMERLEELERMFRTWKNARRDSDDKWSEWVRTEADRVRGK